MKYGKAIRDLLRLGVWTTAVALLAACSSGDGSGFRNPGFMPQTAPLSKASGRRKIKHVIVVIQENRSFDNLFGRFPGADGATSGRLHDGSVIPLKKSGLFTPTDLTNSHRTFLTQYDNGKMDGFDLVPFDNDPTFAYQYVDRKQIKAYWTLAKEYVLADRTFSTQSSGSFTAHQDLIRGGTNITQADTVIDFPTNTPWGCDAPKGTVTSLITPTQYLTDQGPFPCFTYATLRDLLDQHGVSWKYYVPSFFRMGDAQGAWFWNAFEAISSVRYGAEWNTRVSMPETNFFDDVAGGALPAVSWVVPDWQNSDHPGEAYGAPTDTGPQWVAQVVNAIGRSRYWKSSAIVIVWDDWGGWYDHVPPPQLDDQGLGIRVPMIVVSPYAKAGYVDHHQYEFGSIVRFIEDNWALGRLHTTDVRARNILKAFNFKQKPRRFVPVSN